MQVTPLIHVVDDDASFRTSLLRLLSSAGFDAMAYASTGDFLLNFSVDRPGCIVLDVRMPGPSGLDLQQALHNQQTTLPIVFLTGNADLPSGIQAMKAGAVDFLSKPVEPEVLFDAVRRALSIEAGTRLAREEVERLNYRFVSLSERERDIFKLVVAGKLNKQIAAELGISERTVKAQRATAMTKLQAELAADLGRLAEQLRQLGIEIG